MSKELEKLKEEITKRKEHWRTAQEDPYNISNAVYVALAEVEQAINTTLEQNL